MKKIPFVTKEQLEEIARKHPTPFYLYDEKGIRENARRLNEAFAWNEGFKEYFAVKATPNPFILKLLQNEGCGTDCSSLTELMMSEACGFTGHEIMFSSNDTPPEEFAREILAGQMQVRFLAAGTDLSFGAKGAGDAALLRKLGPGLGFAVETIGKVCLEGREVSSTLVRAQVESGDMESAERLLGMPYLVAGQVVPGKQLGRTLGFPTVNILPRDEKLLPPKGVYLSRVRHKDKVYRAISNVGNKPTVTRESVIGVESYLYDFAGDLYGEQIEVYLCAFRRPERRFQSVEALREQLKEDIAAGKIL